MWGALSLEHTLVVLPIEQWLLSAQPASPSYSRLYTYLSPPPHRMVLEQYVIVAFADAIPCQETGMGNGPHTRHR